MGQRHAELYAAEGDVMTDDRPWAEFVAPKLMYQRAVDKSLAQLSPFFESASGYLSVGVISEPQAESLRKALDLRHKARAINLQGLALYYGGAFGAEPEKFFKEALDVDPNDYNSRYYLKEIAIARAGTYVRWGEIDKAVACLDDAIHYAPDVPELYLTLADIYYDHNRPDDARTCYRIYLSLGGADPRARERSSPP
jgi:tetratricopeptide (TPR) repeat protein